MIDVDSDIYSSAVTVLDWMFKHEKVRPGTVIGYDDWMDYVCIGKSDLVH